MQEKVSTSGSTSEGYAEEVSTRTSEAVEVPSPIEICGIVSNPNLDAI